MVRDALDLLRDKLDVEPVIAAWDQALAIPAWPGPPVWIHGDLQPGNLLIDDRGRLSGVIDFGGLGVGDPACELIVAWNLLPPSTHHRFRNQLAAHNAPIDDDTWARGRGWALSVACIALPYYRHTNPTQVAMSHHTLAALFEDPPPA